MELNNGSSRSCCLEQYSSARRSLGRQEPPNAKPGLKYTEEILSLRSDKKTSITAYGSTPRLCASVPTSLAKAILSACNALQTYFNISAFRIAVQIMAPSVKL